MTNATLIEDLGQHTISFTSAGYYTLAAAGTSGLPSATRVWLVFKLSSGEISWSTNSANREDWATDGRIAVTGNTGGDTLANAFPATMDGSSATSALWIGSYLTYNEAAGSAIAVKSSGYHTRNINR
jgi:hypothetical protein